MAYILFWAIIGLLGLSQGCASPRPAPSLPPRGVVASHPIEHVIIIAIDGLKQDTLISYLKKEQVGRSGGLRDLFGAKTDGAGIVLMKGVAVQQAVTVFPSFTYPSWTSMFTGLFPGAHGITGNNLFFATVGLPGTIRNIISMRFARNWRRTFFRTT